MKQIYAILLTLIASTCILSGCNTAKGFGEDMQEGGKAIQNAAHDSSPNNGTAKHS
jgi:predicted small secreted protein